VNWRARPLTSHEVMFQTIAATAGSTPDEALADRLTLASRGVRSRTRNRPG
jgi:hypothetical protein